MLSNRAKAYQNFVGLVETSRLTIRLAQAFTATDNLRRCGNPTGGQIPATLGWIAVDTAQPSWRNSRHYHLEGLL
jgi:hypothetical protein